MAERMSRRKFLQYSGLTLAGATLAACAPQATPGGGAVPAGGQAQQPAAEAVSLTFWTMNYGDAALWLELLQNKAVEFKGESGIDVDVQMINWSNGMNTWLLVSQGGTAPDSADMYWLYSFSTLGGGNNGPLPITEYRDEFWPDLEERFFAGALQDVFWQGEFYGIPWRGDIRPMIYRSDLLEEAGFSAPPQTWQEMEMMAAAATKRDNSGNVLQWGFAPSSAVPIQQFMAYLWQAGGEYMTADGREATIDTPEMRESLEFLSRMIWEHRATSPELMEKGFSATDMFVSDQVAIIGQASDSMGMDMDRDYPELEGRWGFALPAEGPANRSSYSGAGYWGALRNTQHPREVCQWISFLSRDENMQQMTEFIGRVSANKNVMASDYWSDRPWKQVVVETLNYAHTSQHPSPAWSKMTATEPGAVLYDLYYQTLVQQQPLDQVLPVIQQRAQEEMDKIEV
jgi:multiple sugar transport system substrate-binding protein